MLRASLDSAVAVGSLLVSGAAHGVPFDGAHLILALLVFSLTFPGNSPAGTSLRGQAGDVVASWTVVVALLLLLGWTTQTLAFFDMRVLLTWVIATPVAQLAAHVVLPALLPRLLSAEGMQRVAVIAGAGELGARLADRIRATPFLGIRCAGFFDDRRIERMRGVGPDEGGHAEERDRRLELHFRWSLGFVTYHFQGRSLAHEDYMWSVLGRTGGNKYPGFSDDQLQGFRDLADDLQVHAREFLAGSDQELDRRFAHAAANPRPKGFKAISDRGAV